MKRNGFFQQYNRLRKTDDAYCPMTIDDIKALIAADESRTLELKKTTDVLKDGMHSVCAFLNTDGGWLIFGNAAKSIKIILYQSPFPYQLHEDDDNDRHHLIKMLTI